ncbi:MAG TPA: hypothetical protein VK358_10195 [Longimicrobium sp.]|nr:hypothetical protein [Longimicrobium sp.]
MHPLTFILGTLLLCLPVAARAQGQTVDCGDSTANAEAASEFEERFTALEPEFTEYRQRNGFRTVAAGEFIGPIVDPAVCQALAAKVEASLRSDVHVWNAWKDYPWTTSFMRFGPYYFVRIDQALPAGSVGGGYSHFVFDADSLAPAPLVYEFQ